MSERLSQLELARIVALAAVIALHSAHLITDNDWLLFATGELTRFAVPVFFLISGYFLSPRYIEDTRGSLLSLFVKLVVPFAAWAVIYVLLEVTGLLYPAPPSGISLYLFLPVTGGPGHHLWFLPALFMGTALVVLLVKYTSLVVASIIAGLLYALGVAIWAYAGLNTLDLAPFVYRNGICFAPAFLLLGIWLRTASVPMAVFLICLLGGAALQMAEGLLILPFPASQDMSLGTLPFAVGVFGLFLRLDISSRRINGLGRDVLGAYLVHLLFIRLFDAHAGMSGTPAFILCVLATLLLSLGVSRLLKLTPYTARIV